MGTGLPGPTDAWITLAGLARDTTRLRLGTLVSPITFRLPGPLAISVAEVDAMSGGRIELGLGAGWNDREHAAYGIPFPANRERFERFEEQLAIITGLWTTPLGESFSFTGSHYSLVDSPALPKPVQQPRPPIVIGGFGAKRTPRIAATYADEFNVAFSPPEGFPEIVGQGARGVRGARPRSGLPPHQHRQHRGLRRRRSRGDPPRDRHRTHARPACALSGIAGTPNEVIDRIGVYRDAGAETVYLQVLDLHDLDHLRLLASAVVPAFS